MPDKRTPDINKLAKDLINQLSILIKTVHVHNIGNMAVSSVSSRFMSLITDFITNEEAFSLEVKGDYFYLNNERVTYSIDYLINFDYLLNELKRIEVGRIDISPVVTVDELKGFIAALVSVSFSESPFDAFYEKTADFPSIDIGKLQKPLDTDTTDVKKMIKNKYFNAVSTVQGVMNAVKSGDKFGLKRSKRIVATMVDSIIDQEHIMLGLTAIKDYDEYTYFHSVNVSIFAVTLGQKLGLNRKSLIQLGMGGLFHDIGKTAIPSDLLNKPTSFTDEEWSVVRMHPACGVRNLMKIRTLDELTMKVAIVAFEHHLNHNLSGYPKMRKPAPLDFFSRIVAIADQYDAITSARVYSKVKVPPDKTLSIMMESAGSQLDPVLFKFFVNTIGIYPIGTLVMLDTKELGLVYDNNQSQLNRPRVMVITDSKGNKADNNVTDLTERKTSTTYKRSIIKVMDPEKYNINLAEFML